MKKITHLKSLSFLIAFLSVVSFGFGQTTLSAGDIAITGINSAGTPEQFSFVLLTDVLNTTTINFTDNGWLSSGGFRTPTAEGIVTWTANSDLPCGTEIIIEDLGSNLYSATSGSAIENPVNLGFALNAANGDEIIAYQGTYASPTFIYAVHFGNTSGWVDPTTTPGSENNNSAVPTGLINGTTAMDMGNFGNGSYDCTTTFNEAAILADVVDATNWTLTNDSPNRLALGGCTYTCSPCLTSISWDGVSGWSNGTGPGTLLDMEVTLLSSYDTATNGGSFGACSLIVANGATLNIADNDYIEVENDLTVNSGGIITVQPYGAFIQNNDSGTATNNGTIQVAKNTAPINNWYEYTYWSSPVSNTTIDVALSDSDSDRRFIFNASQFNDEFAETGNNNAAVLGQDDIDDDNNDWQQVNGATVMQPGVGYAATHSEIAYVVPGANYRYTFEGGTFNNGVINVNVDRNDVTTADFNWNLIGNPYPSAIDIDAFMTRNMYDVATNPGGTLEGVIYFWSQNTDYSATANGNQALNFDTTDYATHNGTGGTMGGDGLTPNGFIPSGQGFFISFSDDYPTNSGTVIFNNAMRSLSLSPDNSQFFKNSNSKKNSTSLTNKLWINLTSDNGVFNQILLGYVNGATNEDDGAYYDARKIVAPKAFAALYSTIENTDKKFAIQGKAPESLNEDEIINLGFSTNIEVATLYTLSIAQLQGDFLTTNTVYLKDNVLNTIHDLTASDYTFTSEVGEFNSRFQIVFSANALSVDDAVLDSKALRIVQVDNNRVQFNVSENLSIKTVTIFDLLGRQLYNLKGNSPSETYNLSNLNDAIYVAKVELSNGAIITKKAVKR